MLPAGETGLGIEGLETDGAAETGRGVLIEGVGLGVEAASRLTVPDARGGACLVAVLRWAGFRFVTLERTARRVVFLPLRLRPAGLRREAFLRAVFFRAVLRRAAFLRAVFCRAVLRRTAFLRVVFLRADLRRTAFLRPVFLRAAFFREVFFRAVFFRVPRRRAVFFRPAFFRVLFLRVVRTAMDPPFWLDRG
ncbi:MAG: hypothetical protein V3T72_02915 [Thermoanaerobaculia bacterium]